MSPVKFSGVVQIRVTPKTRNPFTIKALSISGVIPDPADRLSKAGRPHRCAVAAVALINRIPYKRGKTCGTQVQHGFAGQKERWKLSTLLVPASHHAA
jgi:hypothetical protein